MKRLNRKSFKIIAVILALVMVATASLAVFTDREATKMQFTTATFSADGYTLTREAPNGPFIAGEDVSVKLFESNSRDEDINSVITMTVDWNSPDANSKIFGNANAADNATITLTGDGLDAAGVNIKYTVNDDGTITFSLPTHLLAEGSSKLTRELTFHIPKSLEATGSLEFKFDKVNLEQAPAGFKVECTADELNAEEKLDFSVNVGWAASASSANNGKNLMAYLTSDGKGIEFKHEFSTTTNAMKDFASGSASKWSNYKDSITKLIFVDGMTSIGDYGFSGFSKVTSVALPDTVTNIGTSAFESTGLTGVLTIPKSVTNIESLAFGNLPKVTTITFEHGSSDSLTLPGNSNNNGAFYVGSPYTATAPLNTKVNTNLSGVLDYNWTNDHRGYTVTVETVEHGSMTADPTVAINGKTITISPTADTGYAYGGSTVSYTESGAAKSISLDKDTLTFTMPASNVTVTPKWNVITYDITYDPNGGTLPEDEKTDTYTIEETPEMPVPTRPGYEFDGWVDKADPDSEPITELPEKGTGDKEFIAEWTPITYKVKYNANTGSGTMTDSTHTYDVEQKLNKNAFSKTGYTFAGWAESADGAVKYTDEQSVKNLTTINDGTVNLYAKWTANDYTVKYNANGGSGSMTDSSHTYDKEQALTKNTFTKEGYTFAGWATSADGSVVYTDSQSVKNLTATDGGTVNLYAKWTANTYSVKYNANGGSGTMADSSFTYDVSGTLRANSFTRDSYNFLGWNTKADGTGTDYADKATVKNLTVSGTFNLYAKWEYVPEPVLAKWNVLGVMGYTDFNGVQWDEYNQPIDEGQTDFHQYKRNVTQIEIKTSYELPDGFDTTAGFGPWDVSEEQNQSVMAYIVDDGTINYSNGTTGPAYKVYICNNQDVTKSEQKVIANPTSSYVFNNFNYLSNFIGGANLDMSRATTVDRMFWDCYELASIDASTWNMDKVTSAWEMFCYAGNSFDLDVSNWGMSSLKNGQGMFRYSGPNALDVSDWDTSSLENAAEMFCGVYNLTELDVSNWTTSNVTTLENTFNALNVTTLDVSDWDTSKVTDTSGTFSYCEDLKTLDVSGWKMNLVEDASSMFLSCKALEVIDVSMWETPVLTDTYNMFANCYVLKSIDVTNWDTSKVTDFEYMFKRCYALTELDLSSFTFESLTAPTTYRNYLSGIAAYCTSLTEITFGDGWASVELPEAGSSDGLFYVGDPYTTTALLSTKVINPPSNIQAYNWTSDHRGFTITVADVTAGNHEGATVSYTESGTAKTIELDADVTAGEAQTITAMPDVIELNTVASTNAPENFVFYGWLVDSGMAQQIVLLEDFEAILHSVYDEVPDWEMTITPLYQAVQESDSEEFNETESTSTSGETEVEETAVNSEEVEQPSEPVVEETTAEEVQNSDVTE